MSRGYIDDEIRLRFPKATFIEQMESLVLASGDTAIHVYPPDYPRKAIELLAARQNWLSRRLRWFNTKITVDFSGIPVRANTIRRVSALPSGRVFTLSPLDHDTNLEQVSFGRGLRPDWVEPFMRTRTGVSDLVRKIDRAVIENIGVQHVPNGYQLCEKNIHVGINRATIVDIASNVYSIVMEVRGR